MEDPSKNSQWKKKINRFLENTRISFSSTGDINFILQFGDSVDELKCTISIQEN